MKKFLIILALLTASIVLLANPPKITFIANGKTAHIEKISAVPVEYKIWINSKEYVTCRTLDMATIIVFDCVDFNSRGTGMYATFKDKKVIDITKRAINGVLVYHIVMDKRAPLGLSDISNVRTTIKNYMKNTLKL